MGDDITIGVTEIVNNIEVTAQPNDQIVDISVTDNADNVTLNITPTVIEINVNKGSSYAKWGDIYGTLSDQTDLQNALNLKANLVGGKVPASELPSYVDDIIEVANYAALPATGETGKIYVTLDNNKIYRWSGSVYIEIASNSAIWGAITGTLSSQTDLQNALNAKFNNPTGNTTQYIAGDGSLITFPIAGQSGTLVREVRNTTGATLTKGTVVYINGANGNKPTVAKAIATGDSTSAQTFGIIQADLANNANGYVVCVGDIIGLDTSAITEGTQLYLSSTTAGAYTSTKQLAPAHLVYIGVVTRSHPTLGQIEVKIQNGYELDEIHDVAISSKANNQILAYESATDLWKNKSIATVLGYTPANDASVVKVTTDQNIRGIKTFLGDQTATTLKLIVADYYNDGFITSDNGMLRLLNGTTELFNLASTGDLTAKSFVKTGGTASQFLKANGTVDSTTYLSGTVAIANGGTGATTADSALSNLGGTTVGKNIFTSTNPSPVTTAYLKVKPDNSVEWLEANAFRIAIGAGTGNGTVTSVEAVGSYGGLTLTGTVTGSGQITLGGTPTGTWPISISGNASSVNTVQVSTNADFYLTFADANNGSPTSEFLYTIGSVKVNPSTGALTASSFVKSGGTSSQYLMADGSVSTGSGGTVTGTGTSGQVAFWNGTSSITGESNLFWDSTNDRLGIGTASPSYSFQVQKTAIATPAMMIGGGFPGGPRLQVFGLDNNAQAWMGLGTDMSGGIYEHSIYYPNYLGNGRLSMGSYNGTTYSEKMCINPSGSVGIGTTSPSARLVVASTNPIVASRGTLYLYSTDSMAANLGGQLSFGGSYTGTSETIFASVAGRKETSTNNDISGYLQFSTTNASLGNIERMRITSAGDVGIGTTSPTSRLTVNVGTGEMEGLNLRDSSIATAAFVYSSVTGENRIGGIASYAFPTFYSGGSERMRITSGGNVGIRTTSPESGWNVDIAGIVAMGSTAGNGRLYVSCANTTNGITYIQARNLSVATPMSYLASSHSFDSNVTVSGVVSASGTGGFASATYASGVRNPIWRFGNADGYGFSYFQGTAGIGGIDTIGFHFGTATAAASPIQFIGNGSAVFSGSVTAASGFFNSDIRLKEIIDYDYNISNIKPITYLWKDGRDNKKHVGYSAQEVQKVMPDAVNEDEKGFLSVNYVEVLVAKIAELENRIKQLEK